ncbi:MAG TPA: L,D-transpeptidase [Vicinamibacterales bacterium]
MRALAALALAALATATPAPQGDARLVGFVSEYRVARGDSWTSVGARAGVAAATLSRLNGRSLDTPLRDGEVITIDARHIVPANPQGLPLVINVPQRLLFRYGDGALAAHYPVAVGRRDWPTPLGAFTVVERELNPTWDVPVSIQEEMRREGRPVLTKVPPGPANPLGRHWLRLTLPGVGIHGTNAPSSIYRSTTHGCIRMHPDDVAALFEAVSEGDAGRTIYEPVLVAVTPGLQVFLEVHPDIYRRVPDAFDLAVHLLERAGVLKAVDRAHVRRVVAARDGIAVALLPAGS